MSVSVVVFSNIRSLFYNSSLFFFALSIAFTVTCSSLNLITLLRSKFTPLLPSVCNTTY